MVRVINYTAREKAELEEIKRTRSVAKAQAEEDLKLILEYAPRPLVEAFEKSVAAQKDCDRRERKIVDSEWYRMRQWKIWAGSQKAARARKGSWEWKELREFEEKYGNDPEWLDFGQVVTERLHMQAQYAHRYLDLAREEYRALHSGIRWIGDVDDYHSLKIHSDDVNDFVERVLAYRKENGF